MTDENIARLGTIPANTGRISAFVNCNAVAGDHPREYGENPPMRQTCGRSLGPSPRIRGELLAVKPSRSFTRTIPANTGRIAPAASQRRVHGDHPREYGENDFQVLDLIHPLRTIPANTGRITCHRVVLVSQWDHPREYGENYGAIMTAACLLGPSPRIRGEYRFLVSGRVQPGTIPANTGRMTFQKRLTCRQKGPSPRIRGELRHSE